jgi:hypothetical protein
MTYTFKLSRRLAASRSGLTLTLFLSVAGCAEHTSPVTDSGDATAEAINSGADATTYRRLALQPASFILAPGGVKWFKTYGVTRSGDKVQINPTYRVAGGTMTAKGKYTASTRPGSYRVIATYGRLADTSVVTVARTAGGETPAPPPLPPSGQGVPFGPYGMWDGDALMPNTEMFNSSIQSYTPGNIIDRLAVARQRKMRVMLALTGGARAQYLTNGIFDYAKWRNRMDGYDTPAIRQAIAAAVADGVIIGNSVMDEPHNDGGPGNESNSWGPVGTMTKARVDDLCRYQKDMFPTLPAGVNADHRGFEPEKAYRICDFSISQYRSGKGEIHEYKESALVMGRRDGHRIAFSMNLLNGGTRDTDGDGNWECPIGTTGGMGTYAPNCQMTAAQVEEFGKILSEGCALFMWVYDEQFMGKSANQTAFRNVREALDRITPPTCARS